MNAAVSLADLYRDYNQDVQFLLIYIREAHPTDGWKYHDKGIKDPTTIEQRRTLAHECGLAMKHGIKTYVDEMDDAVMTAYAAHPERLYLIDTEGNVAYQGGLGPFYFEPTELKEAIETELAELASGTGSAPGGLEPGNLEPGDSEQDDATGEAAVDTEGGPADPAANNK